MWPRHYLLISFFLLSNLVLSQLGNEHWLPPIHARSSQQVGDHYIYLSTPSPNPFQVTLFYDNTTVNRTISSGNPARIFVGNTKPSPIFTGDSELNTPLSKGIRIFGREEFYASFRVQSRAQAGYLTTKGADALGTSFRLGSLPQSSEVQDKNFFASIMATEDNTTVTILDFDAIILEGPNAPTEDLITVVLNRGESYTVSGYTTSNVNYSGFIGAQVLSDKPIAINTGNALGGFQGQTRDFTIDQIVSLENVGNEYIVVEGNGNAITERPMVIATMPNTQIFVNDEFFATLSDAGDFVLIPNSRYQGASHKNMYINSSKDIYVYQFLAGEDNEATVGMNFIPPLSCFFQKEIDLIPDVDKIGETSYQGDIIATVQAGSLLSVNNQEITESPENVIGTDEWVTYRLSGYRGNAKVIATGPLAVGIFGFNGNAGFAGYYSGFGAVPKDSETAVCSEGLTDLFELLDGNPTEGGVWTGPDGSFHSGFYNPEIDSLGNYNYFLDSECAIIDVNLMVSEEIVPKSAGESNTITLCREDRPIDLFSVLLGNPDTGGEWVDASGVIFDGIINPMTFESGVFTYGIYDNLPCPVVEATIEVIISSAPEAIEIKSSEPLISSSPAVLNVLAIGGTGNYEYRLDQGLWQDQSVFNNVGSGTHTAYVRDKNGCGETLTAKIVTIVYDAFFTPNGDNINDFWNIRNIDESFELQITIFDRYGKFITQLNPDGPGWNGTYNGQRLSTNDYWFQLKFKEEGIPKVFRSHFTLKR